LCEFQEFGSWVFVHGVYIEFLRVFESTEIVERIKIGEMVFG